MPLLHTVIYRLEWLHISIFLSYQMHRFLLSTAERVFVDYVLDAMFHTRRHVAIRILVLKDYKFIHS